MSMDTLKPAKPAKRSAPQLQWNLAEAQAGIEMYDRYMAHYRETKDLWTGEAIKLLLHRFLSDSWDEEARQMLVRRGLRFPTTGAEVAIAEEELEKMSNV